MKDINSTTENITSLKPTRNQLRPVRYNYADSFVFTYIISIFAACNAELVTYPLDLTKTRLQIQGEAAAAKLKDGLSTAPRRGMFGTALGIAREEGALRLWQGMTPALLRHVVYSGVRICTYDALRKKMGATENSRLPLWKSAICGVTAGSLGQWLSSPADLIKVQIQMEGKRRLMGLEPRVHGTMDAVRQVISRGGVTGLWKGSIPNVQRAALVNLGDLTTYDLAKGKIMTALNMGDCHTVHILSSICAGFVAAILGTPSDVIKTRIMHQPTDPSGKGMLYKGAIDCFVQTVNKEGFFALYKGFLPCWIRMAPWSLTFWLSFEYIRKLTGASVY